MKSGVMVSWAERCFSSAVRRVVLWLILMAAGAAQADYLIVATDGSGAGNVRSISATIPNSPLAIDCGTTGTDCSEDITLPVGLVVITLKAIPATDSTFVKWNGACSGTGLCVVTNTTTGDKTVTATFNGPTLYIHPAGDGSGLVTGVPDGINCTVTNGSGSGSGCSFSYNSATQLAPATTVVLTATPAADSTFIGWSGTDAAFCTTTAPCTVTMSTARNVTANFAKNNHTLTVTEVGSGTVTSSPAGINCGTTCAASFANNTPVTLTAVAASGYTFAGWTAGTGSASTCSGTGPCNITMAAASGVTATFTVTTTSYTLTVLRVGSGTGAVQSVPSGIDNCNLSVCTHDYANNTLVVLTATPATGSTFAGWGGDCTGVGTCVVTMSAAKNVTMTFDSGATTTNYTLTVLGAGSGAGNIKSAPFGIVCTVVASSPTVCAHDYPSGSLVALTAAAATGNTFVGWGGDCTGVGTCIVTMDKARNVTATFDSVTTASKTLYLYKLGTGGGAVTSDPAGIDCPPTGCTTTSASFDGGTVVTLTATHAQGSTFTGWSGGGSAAAVSTTAVKPVAINGPAKTVTLTLAVPVTVGQKVTVAYTDPTTGNDGNAIQDIYGTDAVSLPVSSVTNLTGVVLSDIKTRPNFVQATVIGDQLVMSYADAAYPLDPAHPPPQPPYTKPIAGAPDLRTFIVNVNNVDRLVNKAEVNGLAKTVTLTLASAVNAGESVSVAYTDPSTNDDVNAIQDTNGNDAASLPETVVSNLTGTPVGSLPPMFALAMVNGDQLVLSYVGPADLDAVNLPPVSAFAVQVGDINGCIGTASTCQVTMTTARTVTATFDGAPPSFFTIHIGKLGSGSGVIKSSGISEDPINCGTDCNGSFILGTPVVFKATPDSGSNFSAWTAGCTNTPSKNEDCYVLKSEDDVIKYGSSYGVTVTFTKATASLRTLLVTKQGTGTGKVTSTSTSTSSNAPTIDCGGTCSADFTTDVTATLTATPAAGSLFTGWRGDCTGSWEDCVVSMNTGRSAIATFDLSPLNSIYVKKAGTGSGVVTSQPAGINCGATCNANFAGGSSAILTATANTGSFFAGWAGPCTGTSAACTVGTSLTQTVTATFALPTPGTPVMVSATPGRASAVIAFTLPAPGVLPILRYDVSCQATGRPTVTASGLASPITVHGLAGRTTYACSVTAVNSSGASSPSAALSVTTPRNANIAPIMMLLLN